MGGIPVALRFGVTVLRVVMCVASGLNKPVTSHGKGVSEVTCWGTCYRSVELRAATTRPTAAIRRLMLGTAVNQWEWPTGSPEVSHHSVMVQSLLWDQLQEQM